MIRTLIVEDDFRVAKVHAGFTEKAGGYEVSGLAHTAAAALDAIGRVTPDLVLLDLYLPDMGGLELLRRVNAHDEPPDVIVLTAARDMASVRTAMRGGALSYLIKPFDSEALRGRLAAYRELHRLRAGDRETDQAEVDRLFSLMRRGSEVTTALPKGHSAATASLLVNALADAEGPLSAGELAERVGVSRATAQRYLVLLGEAGRVELTLRYGATGRPEHRYNLQA